jgi:hypothetical protein
VYLHYEDLDAFVAQALDAVFENLVGGVRSFIDAHSAMSADEPPQVLGDLYQRMADRPALYRRLLSDTSSGGVRRVVARLPRERVLRHRPDLDVAVKSGEAPPDLRARFTASPTSA